MPYAIDQRTERVPDVADAAGLARIADQLRAELRYIPAEEIVIALYAEYGRFAHSPVRDFIPVLVERAVRRRFVQASDGSASSLLLGE